MAKKILLFSTILMLTNVLFAQFPCNQIYGIANSNATFLNTAHNDDHQVTNFVLPGYGLGAGNVNVAQYSFSDIAINPSNNTLYLIDDTGLFVQPISLGFDTFVVKLSAAAKPTALCFNVKNDAYVYATGDTAVWEYDIIGTTVVSNTTAHHLANAAGNAFSVLMAGDSGVQDMAFDGNGRLWLVGGHGLLWLVDNTNANGGVYTARYIGQINTGVSSGVLIGGFCFADGNLVIAGADSATQTRSISTVNLSTLTTSLQFQDASTQSGYFSGLASCQYPYISLYVPHSKDTAIVVYQDSLSNICHTYQDSDGVAPHTITTVNGHPTHGSTSTPAVGIFTICMYYQPTLGYKGLDTFFVINCDSGSTTYCDTFAIALNIIHKNQKPVAKPDSNSTFKNISVKTNVLANDTDTDGPKTKPTISTNPLNGTVQVNALDSSITYTPALNFVGRDSFYYSLCDTGSPVLCDTAKVLITVIYVNDTPTAVNDTVKTNENTVRNIKLTANDKDIDGPLDTPKVIIAPMHGNTSFVKADSSIDYSPTKNYYGTDSFEYMVCDTGKPVFCDSAWAFVTIFHINQPPVAKNDSSNTIKNRTVYIHPLLNDMDPDSNLGTLSLTSLLPANGTILLVGDSVKYTPNMNFVGLDSFSYSLCDTGIKALGQPVLCDTAKVYVQVKYINYPPTANDDSASVFKNQQVTIPVLVNDMDSDGPLQNPVIVMQPTHSSNIVVNQNGTITYTPTKNFVGNDTFTYMACDTGKPVICDTATVIVHVLYINYPPIAVNDTDTSAIAPITVNVLNNDTSTDGDQLTTVTVVNQPKKGTVTVNGGNQITYIPSPHANGIDSFTYSVCDNGTPVLCDTATVYVRDSFVNHKPMAGDDFTTTRYNTILVIAVKANDTDPDGNGTLGKPNIIKTPLHGSATVTPGDSVTYIPSNNYVGLDSFVYMICDTDLPVMCDTAVVHITVFATTPKFTFSNDSIVTSYTSATFYHCYQMTGYNPGDTIIPSISCSPQHGTVPQVVVNLIDTGVICVTYTLDSVYLGQDSFCITICDKAINTCSTQTMHVNAQPASKPNLLVTSMLVVGDSSTTECYPYTITPSNAPVTASQGGCQASHGKVTNVAVDTTNHTVCITYKRDSGYVGVDTFCINTCNSLNGQCSNTTIPVTVRNNITSECYFYKGFSPNGDGKNDQFAVSCNDFYTNATLRVFNRWGDEVYNSNGHYKNDWNGTNGDNQSLPDGTYYYIYDYQDGGVHKPTMGFVVIER